MRGWQRNSWCSRRSFRICPPRGDTFQTELAVLIGIEDVVGIVESIEMVMKDELEGIGCPRGIGCAGCGWCRGWLRSWSRHAGSNMGLESFNTGKREKSRSELQSRVTPWCRQRAAMRVSCTIAPPT